LAKGKQWKTIIILSILNFALSNGLSTWEIKFISSGLGAILNAPIVVVIIHFSGVKNCEASYSGTNSNQFYD
jgi:hypothetical protein